MAIKTQTIKMRALFLKEQREEQENIDRLLKSIREHLSQPMFRREDKGENREPARNA